MLLEPLSLFCTFKSSSKCVETSFDPHSFLNWLKGFVSLAIHKLVSVAFWEMGTNYTNVWNVMELIGLAFLILLTLQDALAPPFLSCNRSFLPSVQFC